MIKQTVRLALVTILLVMGFTQISAQDDMMMGDFTLFATLNPGELENDAIISLSPDLMNMNEAFADFADPVTSVQSIDFTSDGVAYVTFDAADGAGGVTALSGLTGMDDMMMVDMMAPILGESTTIASPKGIEIIESLGVVLVANFGANNIVAFPWDASGDVAPATTFDLGDVEGSVWDVLYVEETDTLYAAGTAGDLLAYDNFSEEMGSMGPSRVIAPSNADLEKVTINLHSVVYVAESDTIIVTDVGAADDNTDGHIYAIPDASTADGNTTVSLHILGPESMLGNPVDTVWDGSGLYVAEKANDAILYFGNLLDMGGMMDTTPTVVLEATKPESLALYHSDMMMDDEAMGDDMGDDMMMDSQFFATLNPADLENDAIINFSGDLMDMSPVFADFADPVSSVQSIDFASDGTAYVSFDTADGAGGITTLSGLTDMEGMMSMGTTIIGGNPGLVAPKGIEVIESLNLVLVANFGANNIKGFALDADGDVLPTLLIDDLGGTTGSVWDILYVEETDTLWAAGTAGDLIAYDNFSEDMGATADRVIAPSNADLEKVTINLHSVVYVADSDTVIVTDVGAADDNTDGHIYAVSDASTADGNTTVSLHILGPESMLGNPVDAVWDGSGLYVAEKANDAILYFGNLLDMGGMMDTTPTSVIETSKPESLAIYVPGM